MPIVKTRSRLREILKERKMTQEELAKGESFRDKLFLRWVMMKTPEHEIQSFLYGYKPAYLHAAGFKFPYQTKDEVKQLDKYPCIEGIFSPSSYAQVLYFQNHQLKENFLLSGIDYRKDSREFQLLLGETLGYPPKAVRYFVNHYWNEVDTERSDKIGMHYCGISFVACIDDLEENSKWLWDTYNYCGDIVVTRKTENKRTEWSIPFRAFD